MPHALILTAGYGEGHNAAARGLHAGFEHLAGMTSEVADLYPAAFPKTYPHTRRGYLEIIDRAPHAWAAIYAALDRTPLMHVVARTLGPLKQGLARILEETKPAAVISTYPVYPYLVNLLYPPGKPRPFRLYTVVTDSISINSVWHRTGSDLYFVPNEPTAEVMRKAGVPAEKLCVLGFPVPPLFALARPDRLAPSAAHPPRVLYMVNAARARAPALVARLLEFRGAEFTVTVGRDTTLSAKMRAVAERAGRSLEIHEWTTRMPELLMTHHLMIGKAGGAAVQETIAARTPMLITSVVPGQEEGNARLLCEAECGAISSTADSLLGNLERLFGNDAAEWCRWEQNIAGISRPDAALRIAERITAEC